MGSSWLNHLKQNSMNYAMVKSWHRRAIASIILFFIMFYFYNLLKIDDHNFEKLRILNEKVEDVVPDIIEAESSIIIDALVKQENEGPVHSLVSPYENGVFFYNIDEPIEYWWPFECVDTKMEKSVNTKICIYDIKFDNHISAQLKENGLWEPTNVRSFLRQLHDIPEANVIDIGANIGLYTLLSAKLNRTVIAVEPLHENLNRMHKAAQLEQVQSKIVAVVNAMSNERYPLKVNINDNNMGGSYVQNSDISDTENKFAPISSAVIVNGILMDDLVDIYNYKIKNSTGNAKIKNSGSRKFVMKIDIEGYEPFAFEKSSRFFKTFQVVSIFMEFGKMQMKLNSNETRRMENYLFKVKSMLKMLEELKFEPYEVNGFNKLEFKQWREWPWDVFFRQCDLQFCPGHVYKATGV